MSLDFLTNEEIVHAARRNLSQGTWDYLVGAAESETTMRRNRLAFDRLAFLHGKALCHKKRLGRQADIGPQTRQPLLRAERKLPELAAR